MKETIKLKLEKQAAKGGGDRYKGELCSKDFVVYLPQELSRQGGSAAPEVTITVEV